MRATDATNQVLIRHARQWHRFIEQQNAIQKSLVDELADLERRALERPKDRQKQFRQGERWALRERIYILTLELRGAHRTLHEQVCNLERRLGESNSEVWKIIKEE